MIAQKSKKCKRFFRKNNTRLNLSVSDTFNLQQALYVTG